MVMVPFLSYQPCFGNAISHYLLYLDAVERPANESKQANQVCSSPMDDDVKGRTYKKI